MGKSEPRRASPGSGGLDLRATAGLVLTPKMGIQAIETDMSGPLPKGTVGLIIGRSSLSMKGIQVLPDVVDSDYTGKIKVMMQDPKVPVALGAGDRITQMLVLPSRHGDYPSLPNPRGDKGFGSSDPAFAGLILKLDERPMLTLSLNGRKISGLLDTGADRSIIAEKDWPLTWPTQTAQQTLQGLGAIHAPKISSQILKWEDNEGHSGEFVPYVLQLPVTLWGREVLTALDLTLCNEYSHTARKILKNQGYEPGKGLGKDLQGRPFPIQPQPHAHRQGLGF